jgi:Rad3-related DNA helicase
MPSLAPASPVLSATDPSPLPSLWPHQVEAVEAITAAFKEVNLVILSAPVGSGKTYIGEAVRRAAFPYKKSLYVCTSRLLQEQVVQDPGFAHARLLKGRANYFPSPTDPERRRQLLALSQLNGSPVTCEDCTVSAAHPQCRWCDEVYRCPYRVARDMAASAELAVINTAYWMAEANYAKTSKFGHQERYFAIVDEADLLDEVVTKVAEVRVSAHRLSRLGWAVPPHSTTGPRTTKAWADWIDGNLGSLEKRLRNLTKRLAGDLGPGALLEAQRELAQLSALRQSLLTVRADLGAGKEAGWLRVGDVEREAAWAPIWPRQVAPRFLWPHATKWLLMSATVLSPEEMVDRLGWQEEWQAVTVPSTFPVGQRPIHVLPVGDMTTRGNEEDRSRVLAAVRALVERAHPNDRCLIHTVSYELAKAVTEVLRGLDRQVITYRKADQAETAVETMKLSPRSVLVACSQERGLDLPDDLCRCVIVVKVPRPYIGDPLVKSRLYSRTPGMISGQVWYNLEALRRLVQMTGRHVRHREDYGASYILDRSFLGFWREVQRYAPAWWKEALQWRADPELLKMVGLLP